MTTTTATISDFLLARLDEDYDVAYGGAVSPWRVGSWDGTFEGPREILDRLGNVTARTYYGGTTGHVARFDPTRVIAIIEAHRRIVAMWKASQIKGGLIERVVMPSVATALEEAIRALASVYSDHPGYRAEWAL